MGVNGCLHLGDFFIKGQLAIDEKGELGGQGIDRTEHRSDSRNHLSLEFFHGCKRSRCHAFKMIDMSFQHGIQAGLISRARLVRNSSFFSERKTWW
jgi:hypothetical protein